MGPITDKEVAYYATYITGHPEAQPSAQHLAATRAVLEGLAKDDRLIEAPTWSAVTPSPQSVQTDRAEIELLLSGTGYEVDELDDRIAAGYTLRDAVISALAAYDRRGDLAQAIEFRAQRAEAALRLVGVPVPAERDGVWSPCTEALLDHLPEWACGKLPRRDRGDGTGHNHWVPSRREPQS